MSLILLSQNTAICPNHCPSRHSPRIITLLFLRSSFSEARPIFENTRADRPLYRSTLYQLIFINPRFGDRTKLLHTSQVRHAVSHSFPDSPSGVNASLSLLFWSASRNPKTIRRRYRRSGFRRFISFTKFSSRLIQLRNSKWASFLDTKHPQDKLFPKITRYFTTPSRSVSPLFDHSVQVYNSADKAELVARHSDP